MGPKQQALERVRRALERTFPEPTRSPIEQSLMNDIDAVATLSNLTGPQLLLLTRMVESLHVVLKDRAKGQ